MPEAVSVLAGPEPNRRGRHRFEKNAKNDYLVCEREGLRIDSDSDTSLG